MTGRLPTLSDSRPHSGANRNIANAYTAVITPTCQDTEKRPGSASRRSRKNGRIGSTTPYPSATTNTAAMSQQDGQALTDRAPGTTSAAAVIIGDFAAAME